MSGDRLAVNFTLGDTFLIDTHGRQVLIDLFVTFLPPVSNNTDDDLLPCSLAPSLGVGSRDEVANVSDNPVHRLCKENFVLLLFVVVVGGVVVIGAWIGGMIGKKGVVENTKEDIISTQLMPFLPFRSKCLFKESTLFCYSEHKQKANQQ